MLSVLNRLFDLNQKEVIRLTSKVALVSALDPQVSEFKSRADFVAETARLKHLLHSGKTLDEILPQAMALARHASQVAIGLRPFDVQIMASIAFHEGKIAEQKTGEGKTLSAVPALYLNALSGKGVHLVTVNDYLARRDAGWNGPTFHLLGLTVGVIVHDQSFIYDPDYFDPSHGDDRLAHLKPVSRKEAYAADITYGTNNEFGFDYLRDNMVSDREQMSQRGHNFAIVDEVDSILVDEARTPLIISMPDTEPTQKYYQFAQLINRLESSDYVIDEKRRTANLTEAGLAKVENMLGVSNLYERDFETIHHIENALKARTLFIKDKEYVVRNNEVVIVDEFTGRLMPGRRWSDGIHQAVEAKENVTIQQESKTLATISFQNYFRMYSKLAGMTGTAATEAEEFRKIYKLDVVIVPTHRPVTRKDFSDLIYKHTRAKYQALASEIAKIHATGQPVLVGTTSIDKNEIIADILTHAGVPHQVLNAKNHEKEATIISEAGRVGSVTIATNIAGRGVDIVLGGTPPPNPKFVLGEDKLTAKAYEQALKKWQTEHDKVVSLGGLYVIGTERHESRRIDNQLRGRSGRQGDPGATRFFLSLEDDIMRIFGGDQVAKVMTLLKIPENEPIEHGMVSKAIEQAQVKVEGFNFDARKHVVEYDDVMNKQRQIIYDLRHRVLDDQLSETEVITKIKATLESTVDMYAPKGILASEVLPITNAISEIIPFDDLSQSTLSQEFKRLGVAQPIKDMIGQVVNDAWAQLKSRVGESGVSQAIRYAYLSSIDHLWIDHLDAIDNLREGIGLRGYGQRDPLVEYKSEAFTMFERLVNQIESEFAKRLFRVQLADAPQPIATPKAQAIKPDANLPQVNEKTDFMSAIKNLQKSAAQNTHKSLGRNDPCPCGSGKKWKKCHFPNTP